MRPFLKSPRADLASALSFPDTQPTTDVDAYMFLTGHHCVGMDRLLYLMPTFILCLRWGLHAIG